jgi:hypothetical protein
MDHAGHEIVEQLAALILVVGGAIFVALSFRTRPARPGPAASAPTVPAAAMADAGDPLIPIMAWLSAGAAVIHLVAAPAHDAEIGDLAAGFVVAAAFQFLWIRWCLAGPSVRAIAVGIAGNGAIVVAWLVTRTIGLPIGPWAGSPEPVGYPDAASVVFELLLIALLAARGLRLDRRVASASPFRTVAAVAVVPVIGIVLLLTSLATVAIASGPDHGVPAAPGAPAAEHVAGH